MHPLSREGTVIRRQAQSCLLAIVGWNLLGPDPPSARVDAARGGRDNDHDGEAAMWMILYIVLVLLGPIAAGCTVFLAWRRKHGWRRVVAWIGLAGALLWLVFDYWWAGEFSRSPL